MEFKPTDITASKSFVKMLPKLKISYLNKYAVPELLYQTRIRYCDPKHKVEIEQLYLKDLEKLPVIGLVFRIRHLLGYTTIKINTDRSKRP